MKFMPRVAWAAIIVLPVALSSTAVGGASDTTVRIGSTTGRSGEEVTARLEVLGVPEPGLGAFTIDVDFDAGVVSPVSCEGDPSNALDSVVCNPNYKEDSVRVGGYHMANGLTGDTPLADIAFRLSGEKGDCSDLTVSIVELTDPSTAPLSSPRVENGSICIGDAASESTPGSTPMTTPAASNPGQPAGTVAPSGGQSPAGTVAPGEAGQTPASSPATASTSQGGDNGATTAKATPGSATGKGANNTQVGESGSGGGSSGWLIGIGVAIAAAVVGGAGVVAWRRRASPRV